MEELDNIDSDYWKDEKYKRDYLENAVYFDGPEDKDCKGEPVPSLIFGNKACLSKSEIKYRKGTYNALYYGEILQGENAFAVLCLSEELLEKAFSKFHEDVKEHGITVENIEADKETRENILNYLMKRISPRKALGLRLNHKNGEYSFQDFYQCFDKTLKIPFKYKKTITKSKNNKENKTGYSVGITFAKDLDKEGNQVSKTTNLQKYCYLERKFKTDEGEIIGYFWGLLDKKKKGTITAIYGFAKKSPFNPHAFNESTPNNVAEHESYDDTKIDSCSNSLGKKAEEKLFFRVKARMLIRSPLQMDALKKKE